MQINDFETNFDAVLVHSMGPDEVEDKPDLRGMTLVEAAVLWACLSFEKNPKKFPHLFFAGNHYFGDRERLPINEITADAAIAALNAEKIPAVITTLTGYKDRHGRTKPVVDTSGEIMAFSQFARTHDYKNTASISSDTHLDTIGQLNHRHFKGSGIQTTTMSAEGLLISTPPSSKQTTQSDQLFEVLNSEDEANFRKRELIKWALYLFPQGEAYLRHKAEQTRQVSTLGRRATATIFIGGAGRMQIPASQS